MSKQDYIVLQSAIEAPRRPKWFMNKFVLSGFVIVAVLASFIIWNPTAINTATSSNGNVSVVSKAVCAGTTDNINLSTDRNHCGSCGIFCLIFRKCGSNRN
jgi:hypothetical protein